MRTLIAIGAICLVLTNSTMEVGDIEQITVADIMRVINETDANVEAVELEEEVETIEFRVTAYCACNECCGKWAKDRPIDELGNPIVVGALGTELTSGSCASPLEFGTEIDLQDYGVVVVEDRTADWVVDKYGEYIIDVYMEDHDEALEFGVKYMEGVIM